MNFIECTVETSEEAIEAISEFLRQLGADGVVIEDAELRSREWDLRYGEIIALNPNDYPEKGARVKGFFLEDEPIEQYLSQIQLHLSRLPEFGLDPGKGVVTTKLIRQEDWRDKWKEFYHAVQISSTLLVKPCWEEVDAKPGQVVINLDPGVSFGTGTHPTTVQTLRYLENTLNHGDRVIDIGCGSGVLSIAAAKLGASHVTALDLDPVAVTSTQKNVQLNQIEGIIDIRQGDLLDRVSETADCVVANLLAEIICQLAPDLPRVMSPDGVAILAGILDEKEKSVVTALHQSGLHVARSAREKGWVAMVVKK